MRFGYWLMPCHGPTGDPTLAYEDDLRLAERAEDAGFEEFWVGEHHSGGWEFIPAPEMFIAAAAQRTKRLRFGTGVISLPLYHPFLVAERMAFLDHLTRGRLLMGVGPGSLPSDVKMFGLDLAQTRPMMDEALDIILRLYRSDEPLTYEGSYWTLRDMTLQVPPYQRPHMPIAVASIGSRHSLELAAKCGLRVISAVVSPEVDPEALARQWSFVERTAADAGRSVAREEWSLQGVVYVADTNDRALDDIRTGAARDLADYWHHVGVRTGFEDFQGRAGEAIDIDRVMQARGWIIGDPDHCIARIKALQEASGGFGGLIMTVLDWPGPEKWRHSERLFARYVAPEFTGANRGLVRSWERMKRDAAEGRLVSPFGPPQKPIDE